MEANEILTKVREVFNALVAPAPVAPAQVAMSTDYTLQDGTTVSIDNLAPGGVVMVAGAPAAAGEYCLQDGTCVTVAEGGVISEVSAPEIPMAPQPMAQAPVIPSPSLAQFEALQNEFSAYQAKVSEMFTSMIEAVEQLAAQPTATPDPEVIPAKAAFKLERKQGSISEKFADKIKIFNKK